MTLIIISGIMTILGALVVLSKVPGGTPAENVTCPYRMHCECGNTWKYVDVCTEEEKNYEICSRLSNCKTCQDGLDYCIECPDGLEGPLCSAETDQEMSSQTHASTDSMDQEESCGRPLVQTSESTLNEGQTIAGEWPWVVGIAGLRGLNGRIYCGGALINAETVITAAQCLFYEKNVTLYFGKYYYQYQYDDDEVQVRRSSRVEDHPNFSIKMDFDIAVIKFKPPIKYSKRVQPICLPTAESIAEYLQPGKTGFLTGWSRYLLPGELSMVNATFVENNACQQSFLDIVPYLGNVITPNMFCARNPEDHDRFCSFASASPFVFYDALSKRYRLAGLLSFGIRGRCIDSGSSTVFTDVYTFLPWINQVIEEMSSSWAFMYWPYN